MNQSGTTVTVLVPKPMERFDRAKPADNVLNAFDELKLAHPYEYGKAAILIDGDANRVRRVTLNLDPERRDYHDVVASEVFHTMRGLGVPEVKAPAIRENPLDETALASTVFLAVVPYWQSLPPRGIAHALVAMSPTEFLPSELFFYKLKQGDRDLMDKVLGGLVRQNESIRLSILAAFPQLPVANRPAALLPLLDDGSSGVRLAVLKLLEKETGKDVNDRLSRLVENDTDPTVKLSAVRLLSARGVHKYDVFIELEKLSDTSDEVVAATIGRLVASKSPAVASAIFGSLRHRAVAVREAARAGLIALGANDLIARAVADDTLDQRTREEFARHLVEQGGPDLQAKALAWLLASGSEEGATYAAGRIAERKPGDGLNLLYGALLRSETGVRLAAARAVGAYRSPASLKPLLAATKTPEDRSVAEQVAVEIIAAQSLDAVLLLMEDPDVTTRRLAMKALGDSLKGAAPPSRAVTVLQARLADKDLGVRRAAVYTLARVPDDKVTASIMALSGDPDPEIREAAIVAAVRSSEPRSNDVLLKALSDESDRVKLAALDGVAARRLKGARETLQMMGHYQDVQIRRKAVRAYLALLEPGEAAQVFDFLSELLYDTDPEVKIAAIGAAKQIHERRAIVAISGLVIDPNRPVKVAALDALASSGEKDALEGIYKAVFDTSDKSIRLVALDAIAKLGKREALDFLGELLKLESDAEVRNKAAEVQKALLDR
jgi:HEAT repeat protein